MTESEAEIVAVALAHAATILAGRHDDDQLDELLDDRAGQADVKSVPAGQAPRQAPARSMKSWFPDGLGVWKY
jgi:hypothetical protein